MVAGRIGASYAAEIGTMRVTEQIDALTTLSTDPYKYLVLPRLLAGLTMLPLLVLVGDNLGVFGGYLVSVHDPGFSPVPYLKSTVEYLETRDVVSDLIKASVFGFIISLMGCYHGFHSKGGAQGVGSATTYAVVSSSILILFVELCPNCVAVWKMTAKIELRGVCKRFGKKVVLDGIDLTIEKGESFVVIGGSGTGKSVLIKCILGLLKPDQGGSIKDRSARKSLNVAPRAPGNHAQIRHVVPRRRVVRQLAGMGKYHFCTATEQGHRSR